MIKFDSNICSNFESATSREWLETNGIGGFANGTISGANTRRYHSILTAATKPPLGRITMLSKFEETLFIDEKPYELSSNQYPDTIHPQGYKHLKSFSLSPFPTWTYEIDGIKIEKILFMVHGSNTTVIEYKTKVQTPKSKVRLEIKPLLSFCDYHSLQHETSEVDLNFEVTDNLVSIKPFNEFPALYLTTNAQNIEKTGFWYRNFEYAIEKERGFDYHEDLFQPFSLSFDLCENAVVMASTEAQKLSDALSFRLTETARRSALIMQAGAQDDFTKQLVLAADQFIVKRGEGDTIIAGYPWFSDWGRDTMIALNGLTLATNRPEIAKSILSEFSKHISQGMIPNRFPDEGEIPEYNTVDASLWYFEAVRAYIEKTKDYEFITGNLFDKLADMIAWHVVGTRYEIRVDEDGLLHAGTKGVQLTWMDAKIGDWVVTPRIGKPVEIQALWYNALCVMSDFAERLGKFEDKEIYDEMAKNAKKSFVEKFWNAQEECLFDVIEDNGKDASIRPNQIFAASLRNSMLTNEQALKVVEKVQNELLTPFGLRSLSPDNENYCPIYIGSPLQRDGGYHQGTVWGWLIGGFLSAYRRVYPDSENQIREFLQGYHQHLTEAGLGQISEIFDGDAPHLPRGCFAQAWSVAEILRNLK